MNKKQDSQTRTLESALDQVFPAMTAAVNEWMELNTPEKIRERVFGELNEGSAEIVKKLLGFNVDSWGRTKWELDTGNRAASSAAGQKLIKGNEKIVDEWLSKIELPKMTPAFKKQIEASLQKEFEEQVRRKIYEVARESAEKALEEVTEKLFSIDVVQKYFKTIELLKD